MLRRSTWQLVASAWTNRSTLRTGDWVCSRCSFVVPHTLQRCSECQTIQRQDSVRVNQFRCSKCQTSNNGSRRNCWHCDAPIDSSGANMQRPADVRYLRHWECKYCRTSNVRTNSICKRCSRIRTIG